jgi:16S rRNA (adenine(1408)-N(1))-methyltransferase
MAESSRRAACRPEKGGSPNARFVVAAAEALPAELSGRVANLSVRFPWGSLLRGILARDDRVATGIAGLLAPDGECAALLAPAERDVLRDLPTVSTLLEPLCIDDLRLRWTAHGLGLVEARRATLAEIDASGSTWAKRLRAGHDPRRPVARLVLRRPGGTFEQGGA